MTNIHAVKQGTISESSPYRWHCDCTRGDDVEAWGPYKDYCSTCGTDSPFDPIPYKPKKRRFA